MKFFLLIVFFLLNSIFASASSETDRLFTQFREHLDYNDAVVLATIPAFENSLAQLSEKLLKDLIAGGPKTSDKALQLIYIALYMVNTSEGLENGAIPLKSTDGKKLNEELLLRQKKILRLLLAAQSFLPNDRRVAGWLAAEKWNLARLEDSPTSERSFDELIKTAEDYTAFHLFSVLLSSRKMKLSVEQQKKVSTMVEEMVGPRNPCRNEQGIDPVCLNSWKAPFNLQTAVTLLGDFLVQVSEQNIFSLDKSEAGSAIKSAFIAKEVYSSVLSPPMNVLTSKWQHFESLKKRISKTETLIREKEIFAAYRNSSAGQRTYQCASCHAPARGGSLN